MEANAARRRPVPRKGKQAARKDVEKRHQCGGSEIRFIVAARASSGFPNQTTLES
jgi:hypothetical protein